MSRISVCDRCRKELHEEAYQRGLFARRPLFYFVAPMKSGFTDMWELNTSRIELCQMCTKDFMKFAKSKKRK